MAEYKHPRFLRQMKDAAIFDNLNLPGAPAPSTGIYQCRSCGHECVSVKDQPLPPESHHSHSGHQPIQWRLIVAAAEAAES